MGKRKNCEEEAKKIKRKLEKWKKRMKKNEEAREKEEEEINTPPDSPPRGDLSTAGPSTSKEDIMSIASGTFVLTTNSKRSFIKVKF